MPPSMEPPALDSLPRGRHHLTREQVSASQRGRLLLGMAEVVAEKGYARTSVAEVLKRVHVSRETFYEHFAGKEACFLEAYERAGGLLIESVRRAAGPSDLPPLERLSLALEAYLDRLAAEPALAKTFLIEIYAAGPGAADRQAAIQLRLLELINEIILVDEGWCTLPDPWFTCRLLGGGVSAMVTASVAAGHPESLPELLEPVMTLVRTILERGQ